MTICVGEQKEYLSSDIIDNYEGIEADAFEGGKVVNAVCEDLTEGTTLMQ